MQFLLQEYVPQLLASLTGGIPPLVLAYVDPAYCTDPDIKEPIGLGGWMLAAVLILLVAVILAATAVDYWKPAQYKQGKIVIFNLIIFSLNLYHVWLLDVSSLLSTLSTRISTTQLLAMKPEPMGCLHGLRVLSMAWIILGHSYETYIYSPSSNTNTVVDNVRHFITVSILQRSTYLIILISNKLNYFP